jgi:hypothetical protein
MRNWTKKLRTVIKNQEKNGCSLKAQRIKNFKLG